MPSAPFDQIASFRAVKSWLEGERPLRAQGGHSRDQRRRL